MGSFMSGYMLEDGLGGSYKKKKNIYLSLDLGAFSPAYILKGGLGVLLQPIIYCTLTLGGLTSDYMM